MVNFKDIILVSQSAALAADNVKFTKKNKKNTGDFMGQGVKNIIGASLISETADILS